MTSQVVLVAGRDMRGYPVGDYLVARSPEWVGRWRVLHKKTGHVVGGTDSWRAALALATCLDEQPTNRNGNR